MLLVVMTLGSLTTGVAAEELLDLPVVGLSLKMGGGVLRPICALRDGVSCIVLAL